MLWGVITSTKIDFNQVNAVSVEDYKVLVTCSSKLTYFSWWMAELNA